MNINENGDVLLDGNVIAIPQVRETLIPRIESKIELPKAKKLVVSIKTARQTNYNLYIQTLDQIQAAYAEVRTAYSQNNFNKKLYELNDDEKKELRAKIPIIISIAEPEKIK